MSKHALIVIKNGEEYLNYFDERWDCYLFPNCKFPNKDDKIIKKYINEIFGIKEEINLTYIGEKTHKKYSESTKREKKYTHYFYKIDLPNSKKIYENKEFNINEIKFKWFTNKEFKENNRIQKVNSDIINIIKEFNI